MDQSKFSYFVCGDWGFYVIPVRNSSIAQEEAIDLFLEILYSNFIQQSSGNLLI